MIFRKISIKFLFAATTLLFLGGCSVWENFTTYFNLYHNTSTLFEDAENEILNQKRDLFSNEPLNVPSNAKASLVKVVEKSSKILQFNPNSSYVDDALIMLGKAFYYQGNYQKSKRKFEELLATEPDEEESTEALLWVAKCSFELKEYSEALKLIESVRAASIEEDYESIVKESYVLEIKYWIRETNYIKAIPLAEEFAEVYDDDVVRAQIYYELGNLYTINGDKDKAILSYEKVFEYSPDFDLEISATIKYAGALRDAGQAEKALEVFEDIKTEDKFSSSFNEIDLEIGKTYSVLGMHEEAYDQFRLVDSTYLNTPFAASANYLIAELFRFQFLNYDSAGFYYNKAMSPNLPKDYQDKVKNNNLLFSKYSKLSKDIRSLDKQFYYSLNPEVFEKDSAEYLADSLKLLTEYLEKKELADIWKNVDTSNNNLIDSTFIKDSIFVKDSLAKIDSLINIGLMSPLDTIGLRQTLKDTLTARNNAKLKDPKNPQNVLNQLQGVKLDSVQFKNNPPQKLKISLDSAKTVLAKNSLELGNLFLTELDQPDSAYNLYKKILNEYPSPGYYPNTLYALGSYYLTINDKEKADSLFNIIYDNYKDRTIVNAAADKLNLPLIDLKYDPAKELYASAEDLMIKGEFDLSLTKFYNIYKEYPKSLIAPQALYTTGWILENDLVLPDSAVAVYDTLIAKYPASAYVKNVAQKVTIFKQEKARLQKALQDSLLALTKLKTDSSNIEITKPEEETKIIEAAFGIDQGVTGDLPKEPGLNNDPVINNQQTIKPKRKLEPLWDPRRHFN